MKENSSDKVTMRGWDWKLEMARTELAKMVVLHRCLGWPVLALQRVLGGALSRQRPDVWAAATSCGFGCGTAWDLRPSESTPHSFSSLGSVFFTVMPSAAQPEIPASSLYQANFQSIMALYGME